MWCFVSSRSWGLNAFQCASVLRVKTRARVQYFYFDEVFDSLIF